LLPRRQAAHELVERAGSHVMSRNKRGPTVIVVPVRVSVVEAGLTSTGWRATLEIAGQQFWCCECLRLHTSTNAAIACGLAARSQMARENA
jgi:hypothetical protein